MDARRVLAILCLLVLAAVAAASVRPYWRNYQIQTAMRQHSDAPDDVVRARVADRAAQLGIALDPGLIRIRRQGTGRAIEAAYGQRLDLLLYTTELHFRPQAHRPDGAPAR